MNRSRNWQSLAALVVPSASASSPAAPRTRLPAGRMTAAVRRGLAALGRPADFKRRDVAAALRWLNT